MDFTNVVNGYYLLYLVMTVITFLTISEWSRANHGTIDDTIVLGVFGGIFWPMSLFIFITKPLWI